jgi:hypothetical protein
VFRHHEKLNSHVRRLDRKQFMDGRQSYGDWHTKRESLPSRAMGDAQFTQSLSAIHDAAVSYAARHRSDPFAYRRAVMNMRQGYYTPSEVKKDDISL